MSSLILHDYSVQLSEKFYPETTFKRCLTFIGRLSVKKPFLTDIFHSNQDNGCCWLRQSDSNSIFLQNNRVHTEIQNHRNRNRTSITQIDDKSILSYIKTLRLVTFDINSQNIPCLYIGFLCIINYTPNLTQFKPNETLAILITDNSEANLPSRSA